MGVMLSVGVGSNRHDDLSDGMTSRAQRGALVSNMLRFLLLLLLPLAAGCPSDTPDVIPLRLVSGEPVPALSGEWLRNAVVWIYSRGIAV